MSVMTAEQARRVLGVPGDADRRELLAAFRRRMLELHPDVSGDDSAAGRSRASEVIEAYRRLSSLTIEQDDPRPAPPEPGHPDPAAHIRPARGWLQGPRPGRAQVVAAAILLAGSGVLLLFFLIAFSQSGR